MGLSVGLLSSTTTLQDKQSQKHKHTHTQKAQFRFKQVTKHESVFMSLLNPRASLLLAQINTTLSKIKYDDIVKAQDLL